MTKNKDKLLFAANPNLGLTACFIDATDLIKKAAEIHKTSPVITVGFGRTLLGALLIRGIEDIGLPLSVTFSVHGNGPAKCWYAISDDKGLVRGYPVENIVNVPPKKDDGKLDVGAAIGLGYLTVKTQKPNSLPEDSSSELLSGEVGDDLAYYYIANRKIPSACALGVTLNKDGTVKNAGGYFIKLLPDPERSTVATLEENLLLLKDVSLLLENENIESVAKKCLKGLDYEFTQSVTPKYLCTCSKERTTKILKNLDTNTLQEFMSDDKPVETVCQFCNTKYSFSNEDIEKIIASKK